MTIKTILFVLTITSIFGCSNKEIYDSIQPKYDESVCRSLPPHQYEKCIKTEGKSFKEYQKEKEDILNN